jgi:hypothetical protein
MANSRSVSTTKIGLARHFPAHPGHIGAGKVTWLLHQRPTWQRACEPTVDTTALEHHVTVH